MAGTMSRYFFFIILALAAFLRLFHNGELSLWLDEAMSVLESKDYLSVVTERGNGAFYLLLLRIWRDVWGDGASAMRTLTGLTDVANVAMVYVIARAAFRSRSVALTAMFVYSIMPMAIHYAREVRMYSLYALTFQLAILMQLSFLRKREGWLIPIGYTLAVTLGVLSHTYFVFFAIGLALSAFLAIGEKPFRKSREDLVAWLRLHAPLVLGAALVLIRYIPKEPDLWTYLTYWSYSGRVVGFPFIFTSSILFEPWPWTIVSAFRVYLCWAILAILLTVTVRHLLAKDPWERKMSIIFFTLIVVPVGMISFLPVKYELRYMIPTLPLIAVVGGLLFVKQLGISRPRVSIAVAATGLIVALTAPKVLDLFQLEPEPWNDVCSELHRTVPPDEKIYVDSRGSAYALGICFKDPKRIIRVKGVSPEDFSGMDNMILVTRFLRRDTYSPLARKISSHFEEGEEIKFPPKLALYRFRKHPSGSQQ